MDTFRIIIAISEMRVCFYLRSWCCAVLVIAMFIIRCYTLSPHSDLLVIYYLLIVFYPGSKYGPTTLMSHVLYPVSRIDTDYEFLQHLCFSRKFSCCVSTRISCCTVSCKQVNLKKDTRHVMIFRSELPVNFSKWQMWWKLAKGLGKKSGGQSKGSRWGWRGRHSRALWSLGLL